MPQIWGLVKHLTILSGSKYGSIKRAFNGACATLQYVSVDHGGFDILVAEEFLDGSDVVTILQ